jgi:ferredoxin-nitrate reductase
MTETAAIADVVLPAAMWREKTGCFTNVDRTVHLSYQAIDPPGEARSDLEISLDFGRRMDFKDKDGNILMPWTKSEEVFEAWKLMSADRPCDYTALSYQKLTGGSGIQWPCNAEHPLGTERLFTDGTFYTDIEYCEPYGHDLETGAPYTKDQYRTFNPAGRAILKAADYIPALEQPDDDYPLQLSTGRNVYHFHTRTKTGRSKELQEAAPLPAITLSKKDAEELQIEEDDMVLVESRRGAIEIAASIGDIAEGQTFIPFHYGYWDAKDGRARAANELTDGKYYSCPSCCIQSLTQPIPTEQWDPISKQPMFKSGAIRVKKCHSPNSNGRLSITAQEAQNHHHRLRLVRQGHRARHHGHLHPQAFHPRLARHDSHCN